MSTNSFMETAASSEDLRSLDQYGVGPVQLSGRHNSLYERHLFFDNVIERAAADSRDRFEAFARSVRDVLSQRWVSTEGTYDRLNPKRIYYLSMEFLIGRSLANNVANLLLDPLIGEAARQHSINWMELVEEEPDAALGNGGLGRLAACCLDSMATMQLPAIGYGLRYEYGIFRQSLKDGWQQEQPDNWLRRPDPWEVVRPRECVEVRLNCSFEVRAGELCVIPGRPSSLIGVPYDRPIVGYGGETINTLRLWEAAAPDYFNFQAFSHGEFVGAVAEQLEAESLTRVLYPDDSTSMGQGLRFVQEYFLVACSLADIVRRFRRNHSDWRALPEQVAIQLNDTHPSLAVPELMRILLDDIHLGWEEAWDLTQRTLAYTNHTLLPEALEKWPLDWFKDLLPRHLETRLMISNPDSFLHEFAEAGSDSFLVHWEGNCNLHRTVQSIRALGKRAGVAINPATPAAVLEEILPDVDQVLVMTVNPGFGHQHFLHSTLGKIRRVRQMIDRVKPECDLEVDGGVDAETARLCVEAGANVLVAGSAIFGNNESVPEAMNRLRAGRE